MKVYLMDFGVLMPLADSSECYTCVYDRKYGYFDECQGYSVSLDDAIRVAKDYVTDGVDNTYAVISESENNFEEMTTAEIEDSGVRNESYSLKGIVYSIAKINNKLVESFIAK